MAKRPPAVVTLTAFLFAIFSLAALNLFIALISRLGFKLGNLSHVYSTLFQFIAFVIPAMSYYLATPEHRPAFRFQRMDPLCAAMIVLAAVTGMLALNWLSVYWIMALRVFGLVTDAGNSLVPATVEQLLLSLLTVVLVPAFCEEILFRGFLLPSLESLGHWRAALISGGMFALLHGRIEALPAHLLLGIMLAWLVIKTDNLFSAMLYHAAYNAAITLVSYFLVSVEPAAAEALPSAGEALEMLPNTVLLLGAWGMLSYGAIDRGERKKGRALALADREPLSLRSRVLLGVSGLLLIVVELNALLSMLPEGGA